MIKVLIAIALLLACTYAYTEYVDGSSSSAESFSITFWQPEDEEDNYDIELTFVLDDVPASGQGAFAMCGEVATEGAALTVSTSTDFFVFAITTTGVAADVDDYSPEFLFETITTGATATAMDIAFTTSAADVGVEIEGPLGDEEKVSVIYSIDDAEIAATNLPDDDDTEYFYQCYVEYDIAVTLPAAYTYSPDVADAIDLTLSVSSDDLASASLAQIGLVSSALLALALMA